MIPTLPPSQAPTPAPFVVFPAPLSTNPFSDQEDTEPWNGEFFTPVFAWLEENVLQTTADHTTSGGLEFQLGGYTQDQQCLGVYDSYSTYESDFFPIFSTEATAGTVLPTDLSYEFAYSSAPVASAMNSLASGDLDSVVLNPQVAQSELGYFDEDLFDRALRSAALEAESAACGFAVEEIPAHAHAPAAIPLPTRRDTSPSPTAHNFLAPTPAPDLQAKRGLKRKRFWGKFEEDEAWFVVAQRKLLRGAQQRQAFREMREAKVRQMAEIVGGEIVASLAAARAKGEEQARLVVEQSRLVEEQRTLVEELRRMVEERRGMAEASMALFPPADASPVPVRASESTNVEVAPAIPPQGKKRARVEDSETAVEEEEVENSRRLLAESRNTENWESSLFSVGEKEVGGASTKAPAPHVNSVAPTSPSVPTLLLPPQVTMITEAEEAEDTQEENEDLWGPDPEKEGREDKQELNLLAEQMRLGLENQRVCITYL